MVLNRLITVVVGCVDVMCVYIYREANVMLCLRLCHRVSEGFTIMM